MNVKCCANCRFGLTLNSPNHLMCNAPLPFPLEGGKSIYVKVSDGEGCKAHQSEPGFSLGDFHD